MIGARQHHQGAQKGRRALTRLAEATSVVVVLATACRSEIAVLPPAPPVIEVLMREMSFEHPEVVPRGRVVFRTRNVGTIDHRLILVPLPEDFPPILEQLAGPERRNVAPLAGIVDRHPGESATFAVDLAPGRYALLCLHVDPDGVSHANKGMASEFVVR